MMNFSDHTYLETGNSRQRVVSKILGELNLLAVLAEYRPVLVGTIPIDVDVANSDLDIICEMYSREAFGRQVEDHFGHLPAFVVKHTRMQGLPTVVIRFSYHQWPIELFGQAQPAEGQMAFRHMVVEHRVLALADTSFRKDIRRLKREGTKTEPAFARLLNLSGIPLRGNTIAGTSL